MLLFFLISFLKKKSKEFFVSGIPVSAEDDRMQVWEDIDDKI